MDFDRFALTIIAQSTRIPSVRRDQGPTRMTVARSSCDLRVPIWQRGSAACRREQHTGAMTELMRLFPTTSKTIGWLLAVLLPLQGMPSASCGCSVQMKTSARASVERPACGCQTATRLPVEPTPTHSCCGQQPARTCCCCGTACQCKKGDSSPERKQRPFEQQNQASPFVAAPAFAFQLIGGDLGTRYEEAGTHVALSGADRCILLCRFHL